MKKLYLSTFIITLIVGSAVPVAAEDVQPPGLASPVIAAVQTARSDAPGDDFVELYNPANAAVDITGWKLQYRSASSTGTSGWTTKRTLDCATPDPCAAIMLARSSLLLATYDVPDVAELPLTSGFSDTGGQLRLVDANGVVLDMLGYGSALTAEGQGAAPAPPADRALVRLSGEDGSVVDTNNNAMDFRVGCYMPVPNGEVMPTMPPSIQACPDPPAAPASESAGEVLGEAAATPATPTMATYPPIIITELFPDPASPQTDSNDEFIELHNPNGQAVDLEGYILEMGSGFKYRYTLADLVIGPGGYAAVVASESHLSLTNSGTVVRLLDPNSAVIDTVASYGVAKAGQAWARNDAGNWQWTTTPSPASANIITMPVAAVASAKKAATKAKTTTPKTAKTSTASKVSSKAASAPPSLAANQDNGSTLNFLLLGVVGLLALTYIGYEYRHEIRRFWHKLWQMVTRKKESEPTPQTD